MAVGSPPGSTIAICNSNIFKAYRLITLNKVDTKSFEDNIFKSYTLIERDHGGAGVKGFDFMKLVKMLLVDYPQDIVHGVLRQLYCPDEGNVDFEEYMSGIRSVLLYDSYFAEMEQLFMYLDPKAKGKVYIEDFMKGAAKLRSEEISSKHDMRVPDPDEIEMIVATMTPDDPAVLTRDEFLMVLLKATLENYGE